MARMSTADPNPHVGSVAVGTDMVGLSDSPSEATEELGPDVEPVGIRRRFIPDGNHEQFDRHGFLDLDTTAAWTAGQLLRNAPVIVWGQPWVGKSFVAGQIEEWLLAGGGRRGDSPIWRTNFEGGELRRPLLPPWWDRWVAAPAA